MQQQPHASPQLPEPPVRDFYLHAMEILDRADVPFLVGGGYAMACHTGIVRHTKDLDVFVRPAHRHVALQAMADAGYRTEIPWPHFLCKALSGQAFVDILYNSGNGLSPVDEEWFSHAVHGQVLGRPTLLCPPEEILWTKAFVMDRDRYDGADVAHLILARGQQFDWARLLRRFVSHERVLLAHLMLFGYIYPAYRDRIPEGVVQELLDRIGREPSIDDRVCQGTFLAQGQYLFDVRQWGFEDARLQPRGPLTAEEIASVTAA